jgi:glycosyltransferase involved in cell wall biosynthesis
MKVLVLHSELGVLHGGGETVTRNLFTAFAERGHHVAAAFVADRSGRYPIPLPSCIEPIPISGWWSRKLGQATLSSIGSRLPRQKRLVAAWDRLQEALCWRTIRWHNRRFESRIEHAFAHRWGDFDVVYVQSNVPLASKAALRRPTVLMLPGPVTAELTPMLRMVHAVCAHDDAFVRIRAFLGDHAIELPLGLDGRVFCPGATAVRSALGWTDQHCVVGYVGRLTLLKGVDLLAMAFREVSRKAVNARLLIVGSGEEERQLRSILAEECAQGLVHIEPGMNQEQLPAWYRAMDVLVMPSRYETLSNAILEAMACGIPFLASDVGGNRTLGATGAGWLFESESVAALSTCLGSVLQSRTEMKARADIGYRYVQERYSWVASAKRLEWIMTSQLGVKG